ncbi:Alpha-ribazole-5'-phosphate phosphatase [hydrothermal vent metagenome]|uniref:Alpha-ribazole-5'-phosphate phosphatase n=1 Tax=hydrothermal vent metagenome TaxID=652676 RepID=A0A3B1BPW0_9ZZZZ
MPELLVDLLRHGEPEGGSRFRGRTDDILTDQGWAQLRTAVPKQPPWEQIITSPAKRCAVFAEELATMHQLPHIKEEWLWEMDFGDWDGLTAAEITSKDANWLSTFWQDPTSHTPPGGEPFLQFKQRVLNGWNQLIKQPANRILLISHGGPIRLILAEVLGMPVHNLMRLEVPYAALSQVRVSIDDAGTCHYSLCTHNQQPDTNRK